MKVSLGMPYEVQELQLDTPLYIMVRSSKGLPKLLRQLPLIQGEFHCRCDTENKLKCVLAHRGILAFRLKSVLHRAP